MSPRRTRTRLLDLAVALLCVACVGAPLMSNALGAGPERSVVESGGSVDQRVLQNGVISNPLNGSFGGGRDGIVNGSIQWDISTSANDGMKLVVSSDRAPAMRDPRSGADVADYAASGPEAWNIGANDRRFGFTAMGDLTLGRFDGGAKWRGFDGKHAVEVARRSNPIARARSTVKLRAEFGQALPSGAKPTANVRATAVINL